jgi:hypothetical protein
MLQYTAYLELYTHSYTYIHNYLMTKTKTKEEGVVFVLDCN